MSQWTHINGQIRIDDMRFLESEGALKVKKILGNTFDWNSTEEEEEECSVPYGSEGSLQYIIYENPNLHHLAAYVVSVYGDLRDFGDDEDVEKVKKWFTSVIDSSIIRQAILEIDVEGKGGIILYYSNEKGQTYSIKEYRKESK
jgi:hypothetical protein